MQRILDPLSLLMNSKEGQKNQIQSSMPLASIVATLVDSGSALMPANVLLFAIFVNEGFYLLKCIAIHQTRCKLAGSRRIFNKILLGLCTLQK